MIYIILTIIGIAAVILVKKEWTFAKQIAFVSICLIVGIVVYVIVKLALETPEGTPKGFLDILSRIPWREIVMYFFMLAGMASKYIFDIIDDKKRRRLPINKWQLIKPFLVSPMIFGTVYSQVPETASQVMLLIFSYQNGFFWQTLLYKATPTESSPKKG